MNEQEHVSLLKKLNKQNIKNLKSVYASAKAELYKLLLKYSNQEPEYQRIMGMLGEIDTIIDSSENNLAEVLVGEKGITQDTYKKASVSANKVLGVSSSFSMINNMAVMFMEQYSLSLIKAVTDEVRNGIKKDIQLGIIQGDGIPEISKRISGTGIEKGIFEKLEYRVEMIARTETSRAYNKATIQRYKDYGVKKVRWKTDSNPCPICAMYQDMVFYIDNIPFDGPPAHPNCTCTLVPAGDDEQVDMQIDDYLTEVAKNNKRAYNIAKDESIDIEKKTKELKKLRQKEISALGSNEISKIINKGQKQKALYKPQYHTAKHGQEIGIDVPTDRKNIKPEHIDKFSGMVAGYKQMSTGHVTFRNVNGHIQWGYIHKKDNGQFIYSVWDETTNQDVTCIMIQNAKGLKNILDKKGTIPIDFKLDFLE